MSKGSDNCKLKSRLAQDGAWEDPLLIAWEKTLRQNRDRAAILNAAGNVAYTFAGIEARAREFGAQLEQLSPGQVIAIRIGNHQDWPSLFLACLRKQVVVVPLEQSASDEQVKAAFQACGVIAAAIVEGSSVVLRRVPPVRAPVAAPDWEEKRPSLLKLTSGTTAAPRAIRFRSEQLLADCENICTTMRITAGDRNFGVIPVSHSYGFSNLITPLIARGVALALSSDRMPRAILEGIAATGATVFPGMPVFYQSFCELGSAPRLTKLRLCISAGAPLSPELAETFRARSGHGIHSFYGASECGGICYAGEPKSVAGWVGAAMNGVKIEALEAGPSSAIRVRSRAVGDGYFPEADRASLSGGVFVPDDLLEKMPRGYRLVGRVSDLINVAGKKVNPAEVEAQILRCAAVRDAVVFARESRRRNQEVVACVVAGPESTEAKLLALCRERLSPWQAPRRIFLVDQIPVNERGKVSRRELGRRFAADN